MNIIMVTVDIYCLKDLYFLKINPSHNILNKCTEMTVITSSDVPLCVDALKMPLNLKPPIMTYIKYYLSMN